MQDISKKTDRIPFDDSELEETQIAANTLFSGRIINLRVDDVRLKDGTPTKREYVEHRGGAAILALNDKDEVCLVRQFRYPYREAIWEIPAGKLEAGELPDVTAVRELGEETGFVAEKVEEMGRLYPSPGYTNEVLYIYFARVCGSGAPHPDEGELVKTVLVPFSEAVKMVESGEIKDAKSCFAILNYAAFKDKYGK